MLDLVIIIIDPNTFRLRSHASVPTGAGRRALGDPASASHAQFPITCLHFKRQGYAPVRLLLVSDWLFFINMLQKPQFSYHFRIASCINQERSCAYTTQFGFCTKFSVLVERAHLAYTKHAYQASLLHYRYGILVS